MTARQSLKASVERQLISVQRSKSALVKAILTSTRNEVLAMSGAEAVTRTAVAMRAAFGDLARVTVTPEMTEAVKRFHQDEYSAEVAKRLAVSPAEGWSLPTSPAEWYLHYHYLVQAPKPYGQPRVLEARADTSAYGAALTRVQPAIGPTLKRLGFDNVLLVDPETLQVFYSYQVSTILGTNLATGPYASSNMAALARDLSVSKDVDDYRVADFDQYRPTLGAPVAFIGSPVFDGSRMVAVMLLRFPVAPIANALSGGRQWEAEGLGTSGEAYLLGPDMTMRTDSRFLIEDPKAFFETLRQSKLTTRNADMGTTEGVVRSPKPIAATIGYGPYSVNYRLDLARAGGRPLEGAQRPHHAHLVHGAAAAADHAVPGEHAHRAPGRGAVRTGCRFRRRAGA